MALARLRPKRPDVAQHLDGNFIPVLHHLRVEVALEAVERFLLLLPPSWSEGKANPKAWLFAELHRSFNAADNRKKRPKA
jgi:hypothetical protein